MAPPTRGIRHPSQLHGLPPLSHGGVERLDLASMPLGLHDFRHESYYGAKLIGSVFISLRCVIDARETFGGSRCGHQAGPMSVYVLEF